MDNVYTTVHDSRIWKFPAGEIGVRIEDGPWKGEVIVAHIKSGDDIMKVLLLEEALRGEGVQNIILAMPYVPYARQDRVCNVGESLSIRVLAKLINSCSFDAVTILDPHSDVTPALINNVRMVTQSDFFSESIQKDNWKETIIISPDAGALKKSETFAKKVGAKGVVVANKKRDLLTGRIEYVKLTESVDGEHVFVIDDILEGGGTFLLLAEQLQNTLSKELAVTHGIFSGGFDKILSAYDKVYTSDSYHTQLVSRDNLVVFNSIQYILTH